MMSIRQTLAFLTLLLCFASLAESRKIHIDTVLEERNWYPIERYGFYTIDESPASHAPGNGEVHWKLDVTFTSKNLSVPTSNDSATIYVLYAYSDALAYYGENGPLEDLCCTEKLVDDGKCKSTSELYAHKTVPSGISTPRALTLNNTEPYTYEYKYKPFKSGIHYLVIINCNTNVELEIEGDSETLNTYGYLSSESYPFLPFYGSVAALYLIVGVVWIFFLYRFWTQVLQLQVYLTWVIVLSIAETATWYFFYLHFNNTGHAHYGAIVFAILVSSLKRTISRVLVLVVSLGYGVVKPTLGSTAYKVGTIGVLYFIFSGILNVLELEPKFEASDLGIAITLFLVIPVAVMDTAFYWWIFVSLLQTISRLRSRKQGAKYLMYMDFLGVLVASAILSAVVVIFQLAYVMGNQDDWWRVYWLGGAGFSTALPVIVYLLILLAMAWIWRPVENNTRYAYSELLDDGIDESDFSMQILSAVSPIRTKPQETAFGQEPSENNDPDTVLDLPLGNIDGVEGRVSKMD